MNPSIKIKILSARDKSEVWSLFRGSEKVRSLGLEEESMVREVQGSVLAIV